MSGDATVEVFGIRHHGPASARSLRAALDAFDPDAVLVEGPADADPLLELVGDPALVPPVALLAYAVDDPSRAVFWPLAVFSPEWQALAWARERGVLVRFCDLPSALVLGHDRGEDSIEGRGEDSIEESGEESGEDSDETMRVRRDPLALLASAAGYDDPERWWDDVVESRTDGQPAFASLTEAMAELRSANPPAPEAEQQHEDRREAHMRQVLRQVLAGGAQRVAVVCGAWHAPTLSGRLPSAAADTRVMRGAPKVRTAVAWVPWTHSRLSLASGYGAGITSPGWYHHLFTAPDRPVTRWLTRVAGVLRTEDLPVSSAHVIEAVRLADTLAAMRGRPLAGLGELTDATRAVLCDGNDALVHLVTERLVVGEAIGEVPESAATVPLDADLRAAARAARLKLDPAVRTLDLDLRTPTGLDRSRLLHRLRLLGIGWGSPAEGARRSTGTFRETWTIAWRPELAVDVVEASLWGTTVVAAASARAADLAASADLRGLTSLIESCLLADLPEALSAAVTALDVRAAADLDVVHLMTALPALVRAVRYKDVRGTDTASLESVARTLLVRVCAALPAAVTGLDDDAARVLLDALDGVHGAVRLWDLPEATTLWLDVADTLADRVDVNGLLTGRWTRLLRDAGRRDADAVALALSRALSVGGAAGEKAAWVEGFLTGGTGMVLVHDNALLALLDTWVATLPERDFVDALPLLRRTFAGFARPERRLIGESVARLGTAGSRPGLGAEAGGDIDEALALPALATAIAILGGVR